MRLMCPKCGSSDAYVERNGTGTLPVLRCRCGLFMYGVTSADLEAYKAPPRPAPRPPLLCVVKATPAPAPKMGGKVAKKVKPLPKPFKLSVAPGVLDCAWVDCAAPARPSSKYCSRDCSNRNARRRHAARKASSSVDTCP